MGENSLENRRIGEIHVWDLEEYTDSLKGVWDLESCQLGPPRMETQNRFLAEGDGLLYQEQMGMETLRRGSLAGELIVFGIPDERCRTGRWQGDSCPAGSLACIQTGVPLDLVFPAGSIVTVAAVPAHRFRSRFEAAEERSLSDLGLRDGIFLSVGQPAMEALARRWHRILWESGTPWNRTLSDALIDAVLEARIEQSECVGTPWRAARRTFWRSLEICHERGFEVSPESLAQELGVSIRTLRDAFQRCAGICPSQYLRRVRMRHVRERLLELGPADTTVTEEAIAMGFTELGRFAGEYCKVFGELPSVTLREGRRRKGMIIPPPTI